MIRGVATIVITVVLGATLREFTGGDATLEVDASSVRRLVRVLDETYPGIGEQLTSGHSIAINGEIIPDAIYEDLPDGAEVHFVPAIGGG